METIFSQMLSGGEYLFSGCKKQIDFLIYMKGKKTTATLFLQERKTIIVFHTSLVYPVSRGYMFAV